MKTAEIECQVEGTRDAAQVGRVVDGEFCVNTVCLKFLPGEFDGARGKIHAGYLPACLGEGDEVCARATAEVNGAGGWMIFDEFEQFGGADSGIPRRLAKVPVLKRQAAEQILHFFTIKCHKRKVTLLTLTIQLSSFTIMRLLYILQLGRAFP